MREIKFRAWNKIKSKMYNDLVGQNIKNKDRPISLNAFFRNDDFEIMQFTGLRDKNGKEIYEGDILKLGCWKKDIACIKYSAPSFWVHILDADKRSEHNMSAGMHDCFRYCEVIGNIHEDPDLLTKQEEI